PAHPGAHQQWHPGINGRRHEQLADPVDGRGLAEQRHRQHVAEDHAGRVPARAGIPACATYAVTTWAGGNPMLLSTPIRRYPLTRAPLTTLPTITTDIARPMTPNATTKGTRIETVPASWLFTMSHEPVPVIVSAGSALVRAVTSALICDAVSALWN